MTELCDLATKYNTDKAPWCWGYTTTYSRCLAPVRDSVRTVLEVGVLEGASLRTWRDYFPNAMVFGFDNDERCQVVGEERIKTFCCDAYDETVTAHIMREIGPVDFFVDDALHHAGPQVQLLTAIWPHIRVGGLYAIEECVEAEVRDIVGGAIAVADAVHIENIYAKESYSLTLLHKGARH